MSPQALAKPHVLKQPVYEPGKPISYVARELGLDPATIVKLASNENPLGPSPRARAAAAAALAEGHLYPDGGCFELRRRLATRHGLTPEQVVVGNGSNEIIELLGHAFVGPGDEVVMGSLSFVVYKLVTLLFGGTPVEVPMVNHAHDLAAMRAAVTDRTRLVFLASPNNPTGTANTEAEIHAFARSLPDHVICVLDEAYAEYVERPPDLAPLLAEGRKVVGLRTFSKIFGLAALRVGYGYGPADLMALLQRMRQPFNVNAIGQAAALAALDDTEFVAHCRASNTAGLAQLEAGCRALGLTWVPSVANFLLVRVGEGRKVFAGMQARGVIVRPMTPYGLPEWIRISVGTTTENARCLAALQAELA